MLQQDPVFLGLTRPTMIAGVPYGAMIVNAMVAGMAFMGTGNFLYALIIVPLHGVSYLICQSEPRMFELLWAWLQTKGKNVNRRYWDASSYSPMGRFRDPSATKKSR